MWQMLGLTLIQPLCGQLDSWSSCHLSPSADLQLLQTPATQVLTQLALLTLQCRSTTVNIWIEESRARRICLELAMTYQSCKA